MLFSNSPIVIFLAAARRRVRIRKGNYSLLSPPKSFSLSSFISEKTHYKVQENQNFYDFFEIVPTAADASNLYPSRRQRKKKTPSL
jgi:hypothetical protein